MKNPLDMLYSNGPVKRLFISVSLILIAFLSVLFASFWTLTNHYIQKSAHENLTFVIGRLQNDLDTCMDDLKKCGERMASNKNIQAFLSAEVRYLDTQTIIDDYIATVSQSSYMSGAVLFDNDAHYYRYGSANFTNNFLSGLYETLPRASGFSTLDVDGVRYLVFWQGIYDFSYNRMPQVGTVMIVMPMQAVVALLNQYNIYQDLTLILSNRDMVIAAGGIGDGFPRKGASVYTESISLAQRPYQLTLYLPRSSIFPYQTVLLIIAVFAVALMMGVMLIYIKRINAAISIPIDNAIKEICAVSGNARRRVPLSDVPWLNRMIDSINELLSRVEEYSHRAFETQQRLYEAELDKQKMDLYLLRKQINAHFVYNSLNSIHAIAVEHDEQDIQLIASGLAQLMRYAYSPEEYINIFDEMQLIDQYIAIMNIRFRGKFTALYDFDDRLCQYMILRQMIQPLVENALLHGLENKTGDCRLWISGEIFENEDEPYTRIMVRDNGIGIAPGLLEEIQARLRETVEDYSPSGIAMINIHRRIRLYHGERYGLEIESVCGEGTCVSFTFPLVRDSCI